MEYPVGASFKMVYGDGTRECARVINPLGTVGAGPIPDTQRDAPAFEGNEAGFQDIRSPGIQRNFPINGQYRVC